MQGIFQIQQANPALANTIKERGGFITSDQMDELNKIIPNQLLLVRCGNGRFLTPLNQLNHFIRIINNEKSDYVRDVSLPV